MQNPKPNVFIYFSVSIFISIPILVSFLCSNQAVYFKMQVFFF